MPAARWAPQPARRRQRRRSSSYTACMGQADVLPVSMSLSGACADWLGRQGRQLTPASARPKAGLHQKPFRQPKGVSSPAGRAWKTEGWADHCCDECFLALSTPHAQLLTARLFWLVVGVRVAIAAEKTATGRAGHLLNELHRAPSGLGTGYQAVGGPGKGGCGAGTDASDANTAELG